MRVAACFFTILLIVFSSAMASDQGQMWQLTMSYDQTTVRILEAGQIPRTLKQTVTPGLASAPIRIACDIDWLDQAGAVLQSTSTEMPIGYLSAPGEESGPCQMIVPTEGVFVVRLAGPVNVSAPASIRFSRSAVTQRAASPLPVPASLDFNSRVITIDRIAQNTSRRNGPISATKLRDTGPDLNRLVFVVMGDGFTQANLDAGAFVTAANNFTNAFRTRSPWDVLYKGTNFYRVDVASNEQGSDNDPLGTFKDTYFNSSFWVNNIQRLVAIDNTGYQRAVDAANTYVGYGLWDQIFVLVNTTTYGGSGGTVSVMSVHSSAQEIALHETGHTFAKLADEYSDAYPGFPAGDGEPNVDFDYSGAGLKWNIWVENGTPLPTPNSPAYNGYIGAFEGARYLTTGIYRPSYNCEMRALAQQFDDVCKEAHVNRYTSIVKLTDSIAPDSGATVLLPFGGSSFGVKCIPIGPMSFQWKLGDSIIAGDSTATLTTNDLYKLGSPYSRTLQLVVTFPTTLMRKYTAQKTITWTVKPDCNGNGIADNLDISSHTSLDNNHNSIPDECDALICCVGTRGNVDGVGTVDISDLSSLVSYLTGGGFQFPCGNEANINGEGTIDLGDLASLVSYLTGGSFILPACP